MENFQCFKQFVCTFEVHPSIHLMFILPQKTVCFFHFFGKNLPVAMLGVLIAVYYIKILHIFLICYDSILHKTFLALPDTGCIMYFVFEDFEYILDSGPGYLLSTLLPHFLLLAVFVCWTGRGQRQIWHVY